MLFALLAAQFEQLEQTSSRLKMTDILAALLKETPVELLQRTVYLLLGQLGPLYQRIDFGVADKMVVRSLARMSHQSTSAITNHYKTRGDLGLVAAELAAERGDVIPTLEVPAIYEALTQIAEASGEGSQEIKIDRLVELLSVTTPTEAKYVVRIVLGKMRLGFSDKTILDALSLISDGSKNYREALDYAYQVLPDIGWIAVKVTEDGVDQLVREVQPAIGVPVMPSLAQRLKTADEMIGKMGKVAVEPKYDGTRVQIHYSQSTGMIKTFARSLEDTTAMFPELAEAVTQIKAESIVLDCEAVGFDPTTGNLLPFQETITRKRKHGIEDVSKSVPIRFYCFDVLYLNGKSMLRQPLWQRREALEQAIQAGPIIIIDPLRVTESADELREFHQQQLAAGLEGAMVKKYDGEYQPGRTGWNWVKFKEVEEARGKLKDTIDGVVMGYYAGRGKRSAFGVGAFLLGVRNEATGEIVTIAKIGTGLSDDQWRELKQRVDERISQNQPKEYTVAEALKPDVWAEPAIVVEVAADELTKSPLHTAKLGLRFPRLVRFRDDKRFDQTTSLAELNQF